MAESTHHTIEKEPLLAEKRVSEGRIRELDYAKGLCIIGLVFVHVVCFCCDDVLTAMSSAGSFFLIYISEPIGAPLFMFCMGMGIVLSRHNSPKSHLIRGIVLLTFGQLLNILRLGIPFSMGGFILGPQTFAFLVLVLSSDIMQFAGLAFLLMAALTKLNLKPVAITGISVVLSIIGSLIMGFDTGIYPLDHLFGFFWGNSTGGCFPVLNWFIFVAIGMLYGSFYIRVKDLKRWYKVVLPISIVLTAVYYFILLNSDMFPMFVMGQGTDEGYYFINTLDAIGSIFCCITFIGILWAIGRFVNIPALTFVSKNINRYYCISYIFVSIIAVFSVLEIIVIENDLIACIYSIAILLIITGILKFLEKHPAKRISKFLLKDHRSGFFVSIWVVTAVMVGIGYYFCGVYDIAPNLMTWSEMIL